jgi:hypothetical protein
VLLRKLVHKNTLLRVKAIAPVKQCRLCLGLGGVSLLGERVGVPNREVSGLDFLKCALEMTVVKVVEQIEDSCFGKWGVADNLFQEPTHPHAYDDEPNAFVQVVLESTHCSAYAEWGIANKEHMIAAIFVVISIE